MNGWKRISLASKILFPPKTGLIQHIETNIDIITAEDYKDLQKWAVMKSNIGDSLTELQKRFLEFLKLKNDKNELSLSQGFNNMHQCLFNINNRVNHSIGGLEVLKKKA